MQDSLLHRIFSTLNLREKSDLRTLYVDAPESAAELFPEVAAPEDPLSPTLLASRWVSGDLRGEDMPGVAADLLEAGHDSRSLRRLAGEMQVSNSAALEPLVGAVFRELGVNYPMSERTAKIIASRQIAREVIAGKRNPWAAANHLEIALWNWAPETPELELIFSINDEVDWESTERRTLPELKIALIKAFAQLASSTAGPVPRVQTDNV
jgi:hypothetical protein